MGKKADILEAQKKLLKKIRYETEEKYSNALSIGVLVMGFIMLLIMWFICSPYLDKSLVYSYSSDVAWVMNICVIIYLIIAPICIICMINNKKKLQKETELIDYVNCLIENKGNKESVEHKKFHISEFFAKYFYLCCMAAEIYDIYSDKNTAAAKKVIEQNIVFQFIESDEEIKEAFRIGREIVAREKIAVSLNQKSNSGAVGTDKDASVVGRAVIGGIIAGPTGAIIGAISAHDKNSRKK